MTRKQTERERERQAFCVTALFVLKKNNTVQLSGEIICDQIYSVCLIACVYV